MKRLPEPLRPPRNTDARAGFGAAGIAPLRRHGPRFAADLAALACAAIAMGQSTYHPVPPPADPSSLGMGVQRTLTLLATSTPQKRNRVRILFYGQSITEQDWWKRVVEDLRRRFPHADIEAENRAIGGFPAQRLIRPAEHDLYPFYPDLLIFHVYGSDKEYEEIIRQTRTRTAAEVLMQKDHLTRWPPEVIDEQQDKGAWWDDRMNHETLPRIAKTYQCGLADIRGGWMDYLRAHRLQPQALLSDQVHLNDHGNYLMAELIKRYLVYRPELPRTAWERLARTVPIDSRTRWSQGRLSIPFEGNRVDLLPDPAAKLPVGVKILIDGRPPTSLEGVVTFTRPEPRPWSPLALVRVDHAAPLLPEQWVLTIRSINAAGDRWEYDVAGSVTGPDGAGVSDKPFTSRSGRVKIDPGDFFRIGKVEPGYTIRWEARSAALDQYTPPAGLDPASENAATVAQGFPNGKHTLTLIAEDGKRPTLRAVRFYRPPFP